MVAFSYMPQHFGSRWGLTNGTLLFYEYRFSGRDTMRWWGHSNPALCKRICFFLTFYSHRQWGGGTKKIQARALSLEPEPPGDIFYYLFFLISIKYFAQYVRSKNCYPRSGAGDRNIGVILLFPSFVLVSICLFVGVYKETESLR